MYSDFCLNHLGLFSHLIIEIDSNLHEIDFKKEKQEIEFQIAKDLTRAAWEGTKDAVEEMPNKFTVRRPWIMKGFRVDKATKDNLEATAWHRDHFMMKQHEGARETPRGKHFAIPAGVRSRPESNIPRSRRPKWIMTDHNTFKSDNLKNGPMKGESGIFQRTKNNRKLKPLYLTRISKETRERWGLPETFGRSAFAHFFD